VSTKLAAALCIATLAFAGDPLPAGKQVEVAKKMLALQAAQSRALSLQAQAAKLNADLASASAAFDAQVAEYRKLLDALRKEEKRGPECELSLSLEWECAAPAPAPAKK
jgi:hypothetical protein